MPAKKSVKLVGGRPWGFKIAGGYEVNQPIIITKVESRSKAEQSGLKQGDIITSVNGTSLKYYVTRKEAVTHIMKCGHIMELDVIPTVHRSSFWNIL